MIMSDSTDTESTLLKPQGSGNRRRGERRGLVILVPGLAFLLILLLLAAGLGNDPRVVPSPLIGRAVPDFDLPPVQGRFRGLASEDLRGEVSLVNVFASWCVACREEHPLLMELTRRGIILVHGLNYKDRPEDAAAWLDELGDPYDRTGADIDGRAGIDWGVYGVPETFLVDAHGRIAYKHIGPITPAVLEEKILPRARELAARTQDPGSWLRGDDLTDHARLRSDPVGQLATGSTRGYAIALDEDVNVSSCPRDPVSDDRLAVSG